MCLSGFRVLAVCLSGLPGGRGRCRRRCGRREEMTSGGAVAGGGWMSRMVGCGGWEARRESARRVGRGTSHDGVDTETDSGAYGLVKERRGTLR